MATKKEIFLICLSFTLYSNCLSCELTKPLDDMSEQLNTLNMRCVLDGLKCSSFICNVFDKDKPDNKLFSMVGLWHCKDDKELFEIHYNPERASAPKKFPVNANQIERIINNDNQIKLTARVLFENKGSGMKNLSVDFDLVYTNNANNTITEKFSLKPEILVLVCNCTGINTLENQMKQSSMSVNKEKSYCWGLSEDCLNFYCVGTIDFPYTMHFSFNGSMSCPNKLPEYRLTLTTHHIMLDTKNSYDSIVNLTDSDITYRANITKYNIYMEAISKSTFTKITKDSIFLLNEISAKMTGKHNKATTENITITFPNPGCSPSSELKTVKPTTTEPTTTVSTTTKPTTTESTTTKPRTTESTTTESTTTKPRTTKSTTSEPTITKPTITKPTNKGAGNGTEKGKTTDKKLSSHPAKAVLIVLAVLIILTVFLVGLYLKRRRRLSNQPAYYNDIALNDPLRHEMEDEQGDDDELPLFT